jgi:hypothetical protein
VGRPPELGETDTHTLWYAWQKRVQARAESALAASDYLSIQQETDIGLRCIWVLVQRWEAYGEPMAGADTNQVIENGT